MFSVLDSVETIKTRFGSTKAKHRIQTVKEFRVLLEELIKLGGEKK